MHTMNIASCNSEHFLLSLMLSQQEGLTLQTAQSARMQDANWCELDIDEYYTTFKP